MTQVDYAELVKTKLAEVTTQLAAQHAARETADRELRASIDTENAKLRDDVKALKAELAEIGKQRIPGLEHELKRPEGQYALAKCVQLAASSARTSMESGNPLAKLRERKDYGLILEASHQLATQTGQSWGDGGFAIPHEVMDSELIPLLQSGPITGKLGIQIVPGLTGTMRWPTVTSALTMGYVDTEAAGAISLSKIAFGAKDVRPHLFGGGSKLSWGMLTQTAGVVQRVVTEDIFRQMMRFAGKMLFHGSGAAGQILGLKASVTPLSINTTDFTSYDQLGADQTITDLLGEMYWKVRHAEVDSDASMAFAGETSVGAKFGKAKDSTGRPLFRGAMDVPTSRVDSYDGYPMVWENGLQPTTPSTSAAEFWFGKWSEMRHLIWADSRVRVAEINDDALENRVTVFGHMAHDMVIRYPKAFTQATTLATT